MKIEYRGHKNRRKRVLKKWLKVVEMFKNDTPAGEIAEHFGKTKGWVYWVVKKFNNNEI